MASLDELIQAEEQKTLAAYKPLANTPRHSLLSVLARVRAGGRYLTQENLATLSQEIFPDTASGEILREHWRDRVPPLEPSFAQGEALFTGMDGTTIPAGSLWKHQNGQLYALLSAGRISGGQYCGRLRAQETGSAGNLAAGEELALASSRPSGLDATATVGTTGIGGGADTEDDTTYRSRIIAYERQGMRTGRTGDYVAWALDSNPEISQAWEFVNFDSSGAILLQVVGGSQLSSLAPIQNFGAVLEYLSRVAPLQLVDVRSPAITPVPMSISLLASEDTVASRESIHSVLRQFWELSARPDSHYTEAQLRNVIEDGQAITRAELSLTSDPITFNKFELPTQGAITWTQL